MSDAKSKLALSYCSASLHAHRGGRDGFKGPSSEDDADGHQELIGSTTSSTICSTPFSAADFFRDSPWLQIPNHRKAQILIEPLYPRGGLLGGSSNSGKMSKLAALAAKRRQKDSERSASTSTNSGPTQDDYTASLNKLRITQPSRKLEITKMTEPSTIGKIGVDFEALNTGEVKETTHQRDIEEQPLEASSVVDQDIRAQPSAFASIMTSHDAANYSPASIDVLSVDAIAKSFDFAEPSPDDIVTRAQTSKGRIQS